MKGKGVLEIYKYLVYVPIDFPKRRAKKHKEYVICIFLVFF